MTSLAIDSAAAQHDEVDQSESVYTRSLSGGYKRTNGSRVPLRMEETKKALFVVESSESMETCSR